MCGCNKTPPDLVTAHAIAVLFPWWTFWHEGRPYTKPWLAFVRSDNQVRFACVWWYGLPMPLRWVLWAFLRVQQGSNAPAWKVVKTLPGCGCIVALKSKYERVRAWINQRR